MPKLTKTIVDAAPLQDRQYIIWCGELKGFGAYIHPTGKRTYLVDYRNADGIRRRMTIGRHGVLTTEEARKLALGHLGGTARGEDPQLERRTRRKSLTVAELCDRYMAAARKGLVLGRQGLPKKASTLKIDEGRVEQHIKPLLGTRLVIDLKRADVVKFIRDVTSGKSARTVKSAKLRGMARVTGGAGAAARTSGFLGGILTYAVSEGVIDANPAYGVQRPAGTKRDRRLTPDEYKQLGVALAAAGAAGVEPWQGMAGIRLAALTGCRIGEVVALKWSEVDFKAHALRLDDSKTGKSVRPLPKAAAALLKSLPRDNGGAVFPAPRGQPGDIYGGMKGFYRRLFKAAVLPGVTPHTLRHSFGSVGNDLGFTEATVGAIIGHKSNGITGRYIHHLDEVLIAAADKIAGEVERQMKTGA